MSEREASEQEAARAFLRACFALIPWCLLPHSESRNREVASLGVTFVLVPEGVNRRIFETGLADWRKARGHSASEKVFVERRASTELIVDAEDEED